MIKCLKNEKMRIHFETKNIYHKKGIVLWQINTIKKKIFIKTY